MMKIYMLIFVLFLFNLSFSCAQTISKNTTVIEMENSPIIKYSRSLLPTNKDQTTARNLMIVKEVADFKMGDEKLSKYFDNLEDNKEYNKKMDKIFAKLKNDKIRNSKNQKVIDILNEAGAKIYNLMSN